jgi:N-acetylglucosamine kinase-like BadF-type ATPase
MRYFLGGDVGSSKTQVMVGDETGRVLGMGKSGAGNHETVGYDGLTNAVRDAAQEALQRANLPPERLARMGFGISGYDWLAEQGPTFEALARVGLPAPFSIVNDALIGLLAGAESGWGIAVVAGSGCNCRGWDRTRQRHGQVTGGGWRMGEAAGASDLVQRAIQAVAQAWTRRAPPTKLADAFLAETGAADVTDLLEGLVNERYFIPSSAAPVIFRVAAGGDAVAQRLLRWGGQELGELANAVIRQLEFELMEFEVVLVGNLFKGGDFLIQPMQETIRAFAPLAQFVPLMAPPVSGAVLLAMEGEGIRPTPAMRTTLRAHLNRTVL